VPKSKKDTSNSLYPVFEKIHRAKTEKSMVKILKDNEGNPAFKYVLKGGFDNVIEFVLPKGYPDTFEWPEEPTSSLNTEYVRFRYFVKGGPNMKMFQRESEFVDICKKIHQKEGELLIAMKDKKLGEKYKGLTKELVTTVFPDLIKQ